MEGQLLPRPPKLFSLSNFIARPRFLTMTSFVPGRDTCRPVKRRQRTFRPQYLSLAGTYQCNLACPHCCVPVEWPERLDIKVALRFLEDAHAQGIGLLGFSGGEPFLYPEFLLALTNRAAELGFRFDRIATNGVWFSDRAALKRALRDLRAAGFSGQLGLSIDKFHGRRPVFLADFCRVARQVFHRDNIVALAYTSRDRHQGLEPIRALAKELGAVIDWSQQLGRYMLVSPELTMVLNWNQLAPVERAEPLGQAWDGEWFEEDYCEGPGQALVVTPRGDVKPCCGFASDLDQLTIGNIHRDDVAGIIRRGRRHPYVGQVFRRGLSSIRADIMARNPSALPGATSNHCFFCWYVLTRGLASGVCGGGGQIGAWTAKNNQARPQQTGVTPGTTNAGRSRKIALPVIGPRSPG